MTTIFSNNEDIDSEILRGLFANILGNNIIEITYSMKLDGIDWRDIVEEAISNEDDTLILCGHGSPQGLYFPGFEDYVIHNLHSEIIHARRVICSWCYASSFVTSYNIHNCIATGMFISNVNEAYDNGCYNSTQEEINSTDRIIDSEINSLIQSDIPITEWVMRIGCHMNVENEIDMFNRQGIIYNP